MFAVEQLGPTFRIIFSVSYTGKDFRGKDYNVTRFRILSKFVISDFGQ